MRCAKQVLIVILVGLMMTLLVGCGEQISSNKPSVGNTLDLHIDLGGTPTGDYRYVVLYSKKPIVVPVDTTYFFLPGDRVEASVLINGSSIAQYSIITSYYAQYFSTFSQAFVLSSQGGEFVKPSGNYFATTVDPSAYPQQALLPIIDGACLFAAADSGVNLQIALDRINNQPSGGDTLYITFLTMGTKNSASSTVLNQISFSIANILGRDSGEQFGDSNSASGYNKIDRWRARIL